MTVSILVALLCLHDIVLPNVTFRRHLSCRSAVACMWVMIEALFCCPGPHTHYSEPLAICPIADGGVEITKVHALQGKGLNYKCPLGIASGAVPACKAS